MLFDGGLDESDKNTRKGTFFTKQLEILLSSRQRSSQSMVIHDGSACLKFNKGTFDAKRNVVQPMPCSMFIDDGIFKR